MRGFNQVRRKSLHFGQAYGTKSVASAAANPGSEPKIPPTTSSAVQANSSNVVGVTSQGPGEGNEITIGRHPSGKKKYKYKYKYEGDRKRKRPAEGGVDDMHMQQKALPGEQYRGGAAMRVPPYKKKPLEMENRGGHDKEMMQKAEPGEQYQGGSSIDNVAKQFQSAMDSTNAIINGAKSLHTWISTSPLVSLLDATQQNNLKTIGTYLQSAQTGSAAARDAAPKITKFANNMLSKIDGLKKISAEAKEQLRQYYSSALSYGNYAHNTSDVQGKTVTYQGGVGDAPGESSVPNANSENPSSEMYEGDEPPQAYSGGVEKSAPGGDPNRTAPITPAAGSRQTSASANSIVSVRQLKAAAEQTARTLGPEAVHGNARERANMGKGALDTYEFQGPYDYPVYPGGRPDDSLTMMGAWRTDGGNDSSLWYSKKTAKGANAKRNKYFKWSMKGGGRWRKMTKDEMVNVIQKGGQSDNRFYGTRTGLKFTDFQRQTLSHKDRDVMLGKIGNAKVVNSEHGDFSRGRNKYIGANKVGVASSKNAPPLHPVGEIQQGPKEGPEGKSITGAPTDWGVDDFGDRIPVYNPPVHPTPDAGWNLGIGAGIGALYVAAENAIGNAVGENAGQPNALI